MKAPFKFTSSVRSQSSSLIIDDAAIGAHAAAVDHDVDTAQLPDGFVR